MAPSPELAVGRAQIGRYKIDRVLGRGGMGIVVEAHDPELDRKVAVKLLQGKTGGSQSRSSGDQAWLLREAQAMARNVITVFDVGVAELDERGEVFIAMELVEGRSLEAVLRAESLTPRLPYAGICSEPQVKIKALVGETVDAGLRKRVSGHVGGVTGCAQLFDLTGDVLKLIDS